MGIGWQHLRSRRALGLSRIHPWHRPDLLSLHNLLNSGGWRDYCYNRVNADSARPMFRKENDTRMRSSESHAVQR